MRRSIRLISLAVIGLGIVLLAELGYGGSVMAQPRIIDLRIGDQGSATRLVIEMSEGLQPQVSVLAAPDRVVIDFPEVSWALPMTAVGARGGVIQGYRFGNFSPGRSRMVLDLRGAITVQNAFLIEPRDGKQFRYVVDLEQKPLTTGQPAPAAVAGPNSFPPPVAKNPPPAQVAVIRPTAPVPAAPAKPRRDGRYVIAIDAGHGGLDPGTIGKAGTQEKAITLTMARELKARMEATGRYRVVLTRDRDIFLPLRDRVTMARSNGADMFISLHADANPNPNTRGGSIYTLSEVASDKEAELLAAKENKADLIAGMDLSHENPQVTSILLDLAQRETMNYSASFAAMLVSELGKSTQMLGKSHRFAGFAVLKAPDVPAVLFELGYLSNSAEEKLLNQPDYRRKLADSVTRAADRFFRERGVTNR